MKASNVKILDILCLLLNELLFTVSWGHISRVNTSMSLMSNMAGKVTILIHLGFTHKHDMDLCIKK